MDEAWTKSYPKNCTNIQIHMNINYNKLIKKPSIITFPFSDVDKPNRYVVALYCFVQLITKKSMFVNKIKIIKTIESLSSHLLIGTTEGSQSMALARQSLSECHSEHNHGEASYHSSKCAIFEDSKCLRAGCN